MTAPVLNANTSTLLFANGESTQLAGGISSSATSAALLTGSGANLPAPAAGQAFLLTFNDALTGTLTEVVLVTAMSGDTITSMVRAQEGTSAQNWSAGDLVGMYLTAGTQTSLVQQVQKFSQVSYTSGTHALVVPNWSVIAQFQLVGGGGGGGGSASSGDGGGAGAGSPEATFVIALTPNDTLTIVVGGPGLGGFGSPTPSAGGTGGNTTIVSNIHGLLLEVNGGTGGALSNGSGIVASGSTPGIVMEGTPTLLEPATAGGSALLLSGSNLLCAAGGAPWGTTYPPFGGSGAVNGPSGIRPGQGGGGGINGGAGGNAAGGLVVIQV